MPTRGKKQQSKTPWKQPKSGFDAAAKQTKRTLRKHKRCNRRKVVLSPVVCILVNYEKGF